MISVIVFLPWTVPGPLGQPPPVSLAIHAWPADTIVATGTGKPPPRLQGARAKLMARRAAEVVAARNLARKLGARGRTHVRGFRYAKTEYHADGTVTVTVTYRHVKHTHRHHRHAP